MRKCKNGKMENNSPSFPPIKEELGSLFKKIGFTEDSQILVTLGQITSNDLNFILTSLFTLDSFQGLNSLSLNFILTSLFTLNRFTKLNSEDLKSILTSLFGVDCFKSKSLASGDLTNILISLFSLNSFQGLNSTYLNFILTLLFSLNSFQGLNSTYLKSILTSLFKLNCFKNLNSEHLESILTSLFKLNCFKNLNSEHLESILIQIAVPFTLIFAGVVRFSLTSLIYLVSGLLIYAISPNLSLSFNSKTLSSKATWFFVSLSFVISFLASIAQIVFHIAISEDHNQLVKDHPSWVDYTETFVGLRPTTSTLDRLRYVLPDPVAFFGTLIILIPYFLWRKEKKKALARSILDAEKYNPSTQSSRESAAPLPSTSSVPYEKAGNDPSKQKIPLKKKIVNMIKSGGKMIVNIALAITSKIIQAIPWSKPPFKYFKKSKSKSNKPSKPGFGKRFLKSVIAIQIRFWQVVTNFVSFAFVFLIVALAFVSGAASPSVLSTPYIVCISLAVFLSSGIFSPQLKGELVHWIHPALVSYSLIHIIFFYIFQFPLVNFKLWIWFGLFKYSQHPDLAVDWTLYLSMICVVLTFLINTRKWAMNIGMKKRSILVGEEEDVVDDDTFEASVQDGTSTESESNTSAVSDVSSSASNSAPHTSHTSHTSNAANASNTQSSQRNNSPIKIPHSSLYDKISFYFQKFRWSLAGVGLLFLSTINVSLFCLIFLCFSIAFLLIKSKSISLILLKMSICFAFLIVNALYFYNLGAFGHGYQSLLEKIGLIRFSLPLIGLGFYFSGLSLLCVGISVENDDSSLPAQPINSSKYLNADSIHPLEEASQELSTVALNQPKILYMKPKKNKKRKRLSTPVLYLLILYRGIVFFLRACADFSVKNFHKLTLAGLYICGLVETDFLHGGYLLFFFVFFLSAKAAKKAWSLLVFYSSSVLILLFLWQFEWIPANNIIGLVTYHPNTPYFVFFQFGFWPLVVFLLVIFQINVFSSQIYKNLEQKQRTYSQQLNAGPITTSTVEEYSDHSNQSSERSVQSIFNPDETEIHYYYNCLLNQFDVFFDNTILGISYCAYIAYATYNHATLFGLVFLFITLFSLILHFFVKNAHRILTSLWYPLTLYCAFVLLVGYFYQYLFFQQMIDSIVEIFAFSPAEVGFSILDKENRILGHLFITILMLLTSYQLSLFRKGVYGEHFDTSLVARSSMDIDNASTKVVAETPSQNTSESIDTHTMSATIAASMAAGEILSHPPASGTSGTSETSGTATNASQTNQVSDQNEKTSNSLISIFEGTTSSENQTQTPVSESLYSLATASTSQTPLDSSNFNVSLNNATVTHQTSSTNQTNNNKIKQQKAANPNQYDKAVSSIFKFLSLLLLNLTLFSKRLCVLHLEKISLFVIFLVGLSRPSFSHFLYVFIAVIILPFANLRKKAWAPLVLYAHVYLLAQYLVQFSIVNDTIIGDNKANFEWIGFESTKNSLFLLVWGSIIIIFTITMQKTVLRWEEQIKKTFPELHDPSEYDSCLLFIPPPPTYISQTHTNASSNSLKQNIRSNFWFSLSWIWFAYAPILNSLFVRKGFSFVILSIIVAAFSSDITILSFYYLLILIGAISLRHKFFKTGHSEHIVASSAKLIRVWPFLVLIQGLLILGQYFANIYLPGAQPPWHHWDLEVKVWMGIQEAELWSLAPDFFCFFIMSLYARVLYRVSKGFEPRSSGYSNAHLHHFQIPFSTLVRLQVTKSSFKTMQTKLLNHQSLNASPRSVSSSQGLSEDIDPATQWNTLFFLRPRMKHQQKIVEKSKIYQLIRLFYYLFPAGALLFLFRISTLRYTLPSLIFICFVFYLYHNSLQLRRPVLLWMYFMYAQLAYFFLFTVFQIPWIPKEEWWQGQLGFYKKGPQGDKFDNNEASVLMAIHTTEFFASFIILHIFHTREFQYIILEADSWSKRVQKRYIYHLLDIVEKRIDSWKKTVFRKQIQVARINKISQYSSIRDYFKDNSTSFDISMADSENDSEVDFEDDSESEVDLSLPEKIQPDITDPLSSKNQKKSDQPASIEKKPFISLYTKVSKFLVSNRNLIMTKILFSLIKIINFFDKNRDVVLFHTIKHHFPLKVVPQKNLVLTDIHTSHLLLSLFYVMLSICKFILSHSYYLIVFSCIFANLEYYDALSIPYGIITFFFLLPMNPNPDSRVYNFLLKYSEFIIFIKFAFQFSVFCVCFNLNSGDEQYSMEPICSDKKVCGTPLCSTETPDQCELGPSNQQLFGLVKYSQPFWDAAFWDIFIFVLVLYHRHTLWIKGIWDDPTMVSNRSEYLQSIMSLSEKSSKKRKKVRKHLLNSPSSRSLGGEHGRFIIEDDILLHLIPKNPPPDSSNNLPMYKQFLFTFQGFFDTLNATWKNLKTGTHPAQELFDKQEIQENDVEDNFSMSISDIADLKDVGTVTIIPGATGTGTSGTIVATGAIETTESDTTTQAISFSIPPQPLEFPQPKAISSSSSTQSISSSSSTKSKKSKVPKSYKDIPVPASIKISILNAKMGKDFYFSTFTLQFFILIYIALFYQVFIGSASSSISQIIASNRTIPQSFVLMLLSQFFIIIIERIIYLNRSLTGKSILLLAHVLFLHYALFFIAPVYNQEEFSKRSALVFFYLIECVYLWVSALQIYHGYPLKTLGHFLMRNCGYYWSIAYIIYYAIPFLFEIRSLLDFATTKTTLSYYRWLECESIYSTTYKILATRIAEANTKRPVGQAQKFSTKAVTGGLFVTILMFVIWFPLLLLSSGSPSLAPNNVHQASLTISLSGYSPLYTLSEIGQKKGNDFSGPTEKEFNTWRHTYPTISKDEYFKFQTIPLNPNAESLWPITPPRQENLINSLRNEEIPFTLVFELDLYRKGPESNAQVTYTNSIQLTTNQKLDFAAIVQGNYSNGDPRPPFVLFHQVFPRFIRLPAEGPPVLLQDTKFVAIRLNSTKLDNSTNSESWWTVDSLSSDGFPANGIVFESISDPIPSGVISSFFSASVVGLYLGVVFTVGRFLRMAFGNFETRIILDELPNPRPILHLIQDIYLVREAGKLVYEEKLFYILISIYRLPDSLFQITSTPLDTNPILYEE